MRKTSSPERYPIVRRFWYVESASQRAVKMTLRCLTTEPTDSLSNGRDNEEYDNLVQYVRTFIETERARKVSSSLRHCLRTKIWSLLFKRVSLFTLLSSSVSTDNEAKSRPSSVKLLQFFVCFASALVRDEKLQTAWSSSDDAGYELYRPKAPLHLDDDDDDDDAETRIALFSSVLSRVTFGITPRSGERRRFVTDL